MIIVFVLVGARCDATMMEECSFRWGNRVVYVGASYVVAGEGLPRVGAKDKADRTR